MHAVRPLTRVAPIDTEVAPTFLMFGAAGRMTIVATALGGLWLAIAAVLGWIGG